MSNKTGDEQQAICDHIRTAVLNTEYDSLDTAADPPEYLAFSADYSGKIDFLTNKASLSISDLKTKWTSHKDGCTDCEGWSI